MSWLKEICSDFGVFVIVRGAGEFRSCPSFFAFCFSMRPLISTCAVQPQLSFHPLGSSLHFEEEKKEEAKEESGDDMGLADE